nr:glycosyltransferase family 4 protein [Polymorphobacter sp.]
MKIVVLASLAYSLTNFRGQLLAAMVKAGHEVVACAPEDSAEARAALAAIGVRYRPIAMQRANSNPFVDARTLWDYVRLLREERPEAVLAYTQKPIVWGGIAARIVGGMRYHAMCSGLGYVFTDDGEASRSLKRRGLRSIVSRLYRMAVAKADTVFVFNSDDGEEMRRLGILAPGQRVIQVPGSGVDTARFQAVPVPKGPPVFLLIARLLRDKGLVEFAEAARMVRAQWPEAQFRLLGPLDANPSGVTLAELAEWNASGGVEYLGETRDVAPYLAAASVFVLPSFYREGLPRTILEALATGRAIITTDAPGCREPIEVGGNGFLVPVRDAAALAGAMAAFMRDPGLAARMGARSREIAVARFDANKVNALLLASMKLDRANVVPLVQPVARRVSARA